MIYVEIIKGHVGQILPCGRVTGNKEFTIGGPMFLMISNCSTHFYAKQNKFDQVKKWLQLKKNIAKWLPIMKTSYIASSQLKL